MLRGASTTAGSPAGTDSEMVSPFVLLQAVRSVPLREEDMTEGTIDETFKVLNLLNNICSTTFFLMLVSNLFFCINDT